MDAERGTDDLRLWLYVSESCIESPGEGEAIADIVAVSRQRNSRLEVTGALVFTGGRFAQLLEGPEPGVTELKDSIVRDGRHKRVTTLCWNAASERIFDRWSLVYSGGSRYMAGILDKVELEVVSAPAETCEQLVYLFREFAEAEQRDSYRR
jgi:hypothetical protein